MLIRGIATLAHHLAPNRRLLHGGIDSHLLYGSPGNLKGVYGKRGK